MHWYRTVAQISLALSILNIVLAAPIVVRPVHEARGDGTVTAEDVTVIPKRSRELEAVSERSTSPRSPVDVNPMGTLHRSDSWDSSDSGSSWMWSRPPGLSPTFPASLHELGSSSSGPSRTQLPQELEAEVPPSLHLPAPLHDSAYPRPSSSWSPWIPDMPLPEWRQEFAQAPERAPSPLLPVSQAPVSPLASPPHLSSGLFDIQLPEWMQELVAEMRSSPHLPASLHGSASPPPSISGSSEIPDMPVPQWLQEFAPGPERPLSPSPSSSGSSEIPDMPVPQWLQEFAPGPERPPSPLASPHPSSSGSSGIPDMSPEWLQGFAPAPERAPSPPLPVSQAPVSPLATPHHSSAGLSDIQLPEWMQELVREMPSSPHLPASLHGSASPPPSISGLSETEPPDWMPPLPASQGLASPLTSHLSSSGSSGIPETRLAEWLQALVHAQERPTSSQPTGSDRATTGTYPSPNQFTPLHDPLSSTGWHSDESISSPFLSASGGSVSSLYSSALDEPVPSHDSMPGRLDVSPPLPSTEAPPDNAEFLNELFMRLSGAH